MAQSNSLLEQARNGDCKAINILLSRQLAPKNTKVQANQKSGVLNILFEAEQTPSQTQLVPWITTALNNLHPAGIKVVRLYARTKGQSEFAWKTQIEIGQEENTSIINKINTNGEKTKKKTISNNANSSAIEPKKSKSSRKNTKAKKTREEKWHPAIRVVLFLCLILLMIKDFNSLFMAILFGLFPAFIAKREGRNFLNWWLYGSGLFIASIVHIFVIVYEQESSQKKEGILKHKIDAFTLLSLFFAIVFCLPGVSIAAVEVGSIYSIFIILPYLIPGFLCAYIAIKKNMNFLRWFAFGIMSVFLLLIPLVLVFVLQGKTHEQIMEEKNKHEEREKAQKLALENQQKQEEKRLNTLLNNETLVFKQSASYRGGVKGFPQRLEEIGTAYITNSSFIFFNSVMDFKLFHSRIIDATLDSFQMGEARAFWAAGDVARQLQNIKNVVNINYLDEDNIERDAKFQIHGAALMMQGEALKAQEFLNYFLDFKKDFYKKDAGFKSQDDNDVFVKIQKLKNLLDQDIITQDEFEEKKKKLLDDV